MHIIISQEPPFFATKIICRTSKEEVVPKSNCFYTLNKCFFFLYRKQSSYINLFRVIFNYAHNGVDLMICRITQGTTYDFYALLLS